MARASAAVRRRATRFQDRAARAAVALALPE